ncbi:MAG: hypothetical protein OEW06_03450 [Gemmatimonadota bacterium]|nr:hypothetical protein [Gemmatimonadota bacterium]MDH4349703.1 hypothetical protein [Gemmatimonadota bacterium]
MVSRHLRGRAGKVPVKFLLTMTVLGGIIYYGIGAGGGFLKYYQMKDEAGVQARFATNQTDEVIRRRMREKATALNLPPAAQRITVRRRARPREIFITTAWPDTIVLPFYRLVHTYRVEARAPL